jgi:hypothetical protein
MKKRIDVAATAVLTGTGYPSPFDEPCRKLWYDANIRRGRWFQGRFEHRAAGCMPLHRNQTFAPTRSKAIGGARAVLLIVDYPVMGPKDDDAGRLDFVQDGYLAETIGVDFEFPGDSDFLIREHDLPSVWP